MYQGCFVSLVTPFLKSLQIDEKRWQELILWHLKEGSQGFVIASDIGEGFFLTVEEKLNLLKKALEITQKSVPVILETSFQNTTSCKWLIKQAKALGVDACLIELPSYSKENEEAYFSYFYDLSKMEVPLIMRYSPKEKKWPVQVLRELSTLPHVLGIQEASGEVALTQAILSGCHITIFSGHDDMTYSLMQNGAKGSFSVLANVMPSLGSKLVSSYFNQEYDKALLLQKKYKRLGEMFKVDRQELGVKYALSLLDKCLPYTRSTPTPLSEKQQKKIQDFLKNFSFP
ncbi:MAG: hypothetical protein FJZ63_03705 [Chlamydiae bacterium]|nr:hypothetical protein [Chlamydiota bacterium]